MLTSEQSLRLKCMTLAAKLADSNSTDALIKNAELLVNYVIEGQPEDDETTFTFSEPGANQADGAFAGISPACKIVPLDVPLPQPTTSVISVPPADGSWLQNGPVTVSEAVASSNTGFAMASTATAVVPPIETVTVTTGDTPAMDTPTVTVDAPATSAPVADAPAPEVAPSPDATVLDTDPALAAQVEAQTAAEVPANDTSTPPADTSTEPVSVADAPVSEVISDAPVTDTAQPQNEPVATPEATEVIVETPEQKTDESAAA